MPVDDNLRQISSLRVPLSEVPAIQKPGQPRTIRRFRLFESSGLNHGERRDVRLYLDFMALDQLAEQARSSPTGRVVIHGVEVEMEEREDDRGNRFFVAKFVGSAVPEWTGAETTITAAR